MTKSIKINLVSLLISILFAGCNQNMLNDKCKELIVIDQVNQQEINKYSCEVEKINSEDTLVFNYHAFDSVGVIFQASLKIIDNKVFLDNNLLEYVDSVKIDLKSKETFIEKYYMNLKHRSGLFLVYLNKENGLYVIEDEVNYLVFDRNNKNIINLINEIEKSK
jgi:hypothetical protein